MSDSINVRVTLDAYDMASTGRQTQVYVQIPEVARVSWLLPEDRFHGLVDRAWPEVLDVTHDYVTYGSAASNSSTTAAWKAVREWLRDNTNRDEMQAAWEQDQAQRHPVARKLLQENTELKEQRERRRARLVALQNDALNMRGVLSPNGEDRKVPFPLGETLTPAVEWLVGRVAELEAERHTTNEALSDAAEQLRANRDQIAGLELAEGLACAAEADAKARVAELEAEPLAWATLLDATSLGNFLHTLGMATEVYPVDGALSQVREVIRSFREALPAGAEEERTRALHDRTVARDAEIDGLRARLAEYERPVDEEPIRFTLTEQAEGEPTEDDVRPQVRKLRSILAGQREQAEADDQARCLKAHPFSPRDGWRMVCGNCDHGKDAACHQGGDA
ncbi:hypothetical protein [Streptomyces sp. NPDC008137]|uniref:hypothetical protein n=1 Tax=Streptomyces sp. NPDC008137 TaxID=3364813 RepID=UPI0036EB2934